MKSRLIALLMALALLLGGVNVSLAETAEPITLTCFIDHNWFWTDEWTGIIPETITEKTGVRLEVTRAVDDQQLGIMIASTDLPDLVYTAANLDRLSTPEACYSYNELIEQYGLEWQPDPTLITNARSFSSDDSYYTLLQNFSTQEEVNASPSSLMVASLGYRADILEALGNPSMATMDEFMNGLGMVRSSIQT